jgi:hypothetical protein
MEHQEQNCVGSSGTSGTNGNQDGSLGSIASSGTTVNGSLGSVGKVGGVAGSTINGTSGTSGSSCLNGTSGTSGTSGIIQRTDCTYYPDEGIVVYQTYDSGWHGRMCCYDDVTPGWASQNWWAAMGAATTCTVGGFTDWRVPTIAELQDLYDHVFPQPNCIPDRFTGYFYWSSTESGSESAWVKSFYSGEDRPVTVANKTATGCTRLIRDF